MVDISAIWTATKIAVDASKKGLELAKKAAHQDLIEHAQNMRDQVIDLKENVAEMRQYIAALEEQLKFNEQLKWNGRCWEYDDKNGEKCYVCPGCEADGIVSHMTFLPDRVGGDIAKCSKCEAQIFVTDKFQQPVVRKRRTRSRI